MTQEPYQDPKPRSGKRVLNYLRSMRFGILLLVIIIFFSLIGSLIPQGRSVNFYTQNFAPISDLIVAFGLGEIFTSPLFIGALALLCLNLILCTIARLRTKSNLLPTLQRRLNQLVAQPVEDQERLQSWLTRRGFKALPGSANTFARGLTGAWGSALVHLSFLLILLVGAYVLYTAQSTDITIFTGESQTLPDGSRITLDRFHTQDEAGRLDYISDLSVTPPGSTEVQNLRLRVNQPLRVGNYTLYQLSYSLYGRVVIAGPGGSREMLLEGPRDITMDITAPVLYQGLFPDYTTEADGSYTVSMDASNGYPNPIYLLDLVQENSTETIVVPPGNQFELGTAIYHFSDPVSSSVIRVKTLAPMLWVLYAAFGLLTLALYLTFFVVPTLISVDSHGYRLASSKTDPMLQRELAEFNLVSKDEPL